MTNRSLLAAGCALLVAFGTAVAQETTRPPAGKQTPVIKERERIQQRRINQGVKSGQLTRPETRRLRTEQHKVKKDVAKAKSDGTVTAAERQKIRREQNRTSRDIVRKKHNARTR